VCSSDLVLGDLIHGRDSITPRLQQEVTDWLGARPTLAVELIRGNHDRHTPCLPPMWRITERGHHVVEAPFAFVHDPDHAKLAPADTAFTWAGHLHPTVCLLGRREAVRLPCFQLLPALGVLPAFSDFTGGVRVTHGTCYAVTDRRVIPVPPGALAG